MPTYQYACTTCDHRLEAVQSFAEPALTQCPECEGKLRKLFSSVGIVFKGSGFYRTDARAAAEKTNGKTAEKSAEKTGTEKSTADKPAADKSKPAESAPKPAAKDKAPAATSTS